MHRFLAGERGLDFFHALDLLELALGLRGFAGLGAEAIGKFLERCDLALLVLVGGKLLLLAVQRPSSSTVAVPVATVARFNRRWAISTMEPTRWFRNSRSWEIMRIAPE